MSEKPQHETTLDIGAEQLGKPYARALIGAASKEGVADDVIAQLSEVVDDCLAENPRLEAALASPRISSAEKDRVIDRLFSKQVHPVLVKTMKVMNAHGRLGFLRAVRDSAVVILDDQLGRVIAEVRTAVPLTDDLRSLVTKQIGQSLGKQVRLRETVDQSLIGGMVVRIGDSIIDSSVAGRLDKVGKAVNRGFARQLLEQAGNFVSEEASGEATAN